MNTSAIRSPLAACALAALAFLGATSAYVIAMDQSHTSTHTLPACATEDSDNCAWDATTQGNGTGRSFVTIHGVTHYTDGSK